MTTRLGVDVGGTFTDLIFYDEATGETRVGKAPTTPGVARAGRPARGRGRRPGASGCGRGVLPARHDRRPQRAARAPRGRGRPARHARASATCSRSAAATASTCTTCSGASPRRWCRAGCGCRCASACSRPARCTRRSTLDDVRAAAETFEAEGCTAVAIAFLHAYANGEHELAAASALREAGFDGEISLSHQVCGEYREYERTTTTVIDAFVRGADGPLPRPAGERARRARLRRAPRSSPARAAAR